MKKVKSQFQTVHVVIAKNLSRQEASIKAFNKAKRLYGKNDARGISYDPKTGKASVT